MAVVIASRKWTDRVAVRRCGRPAAILLALLMAGCANLIPGQRQVSLPEVPKQTEAPQGAQREHERILAS